MRESFILYKSFYEPIKDLSTEKKGLLLDAIFVYQINGTEIELPSDLKMAFTFFKNQFRLDDEKYSNVVERNKVNGSKGGRPKTQDNPENPVGFEEPKEPKKADNENDKDNEKDKENVKEERKRFCKPSLQELTNFCNLNAYNIDPENFLNFYNSKDWMIGKNKMVDWESAVRTWVKRKEKTTTKKTTIENNDDELRKFLNEENHA